MPTTVREPHDHPATAARRAARRALLAGCALALLAAACGRASDDRRSVLVFAAASLTVSFEALAKAFEAANPDCAVQVSFGGSQQLALQIQQGARADLFASADLANLQKVVDLGAAAGAPRTFAQNGLAIAVGAGNPKGIASLVDLARGDLRVALCGEEVPVGKYARAALAKAGVALRSVSDEANVKALVAKVRLGEIDAAIAYRTDVVGKDVAAVAIPPEHDVVAEYPLAVLTTGSERAGAEAFAAFVLGEQGRAILRAHGFQVP